MTGARNEEWPAMATAHSRKVEMTSLWRGPRPFFLDIRRGGFTFF